MINKIKFNLTLILLTFFIALTNSALGQENIVLTVEWKAPVEAILNGKSFIIPKIEGQGYNNNLPNFYWTKKVDHNTNYAFSLQNFTTTTCPKEDKLFLEGNGTIIPTKFEPEIVISNSGKETYAAVNFFPYIIENEVLKRISSISVDLSSLGKKQKSIAAKAFATQSVLREGSGTWYKISIAEDGIFKMDKAFLEACGISTTNLNPNHINIYGNGEGQLPELNSVYRTDDLAKNAIQIVGGQDGSFDANDYILFYGFGPNRWYPNGLADFDRKMNTYSDVSYYFININSNETPSRIQDLNSTTDPSNYDVTEVDYRTIYEKETKNLVKGGQRWYGDVFDVELTKTINFSIPNIGTTPISYRMALAGNSQSNTGNTFATTVNGVVVNSMNIPYIGPNGGDYVRGTAYFTSNPSSNLTVTFTANRITPKVITYLDFITINARRSLNFFGSQMDFRDLKSVNPGRISKYTVSNFNTNYFVWDITDRHNPKKVIGNQFGSTYEFTLATDYLREFVASNAQNFLEPTRVGNVAYQNLHALPQVDYVVVSHPSFISHANRLADIHRADGLTVHVVNENDIFNEFSSGMKDASAIRFFMKMFYDRGQITNDPPKFLLLFGDGTYDNRGKTTSENYIMTYQVDDSENHVAALVSDDYFGMLDDNESFTSANMMDIGIGRLLISNTQIAREQVDKVEHYLKNGSNFYSTPGDCDCSPSKTINTFGDWRLKYVQIADDPDLTFSTPYDFVTKDTEPQVAKVDLYRQEMNADKIYCDAYQQVSGAGGQRYPEVNEAINDRIRRGALVINYVGHGGETGVAEERIITVPQILAWKNPNALPLIVSATCEFTKYDDPDRVSAGEWASLNAKGGAIALMTTTRSVYFDVNTETAIKFYQNVFQRGADSLPRPFGDIIRTTKNETNQGDNKRSFTLIGDPALRIAMPRLTIKADSIYREGTGNAHDTVRALDKMTLVGHVEDLNGNLLTGFNGIVSPTIFDKPNTEYTLGQDPGAPIITYTLQKNAIFKGQATVENGYFKISFIVPKDINFGVGQGKISMYGHNNVTDAMGYDKSVVIGGINPNGLADDKGPDIELYMNEETFVTGGMTDENPILIAKLFDENGINAVGSGIGHNITAIIDANSAAPVILNEYYLADLNTYQSGVVNYNYANLEPGRHTLTVKAWDVNNNSSEATIEFVVQEKLNPELSHVLNYPNPFTTNTKFYFEHNQVNSALETQIQVFTVTGKLVKTINQLVNTQGFRSEGIAWDGRDDFGDQLAKGVYVYRVSIKTNKGEMAEKLEKLVILK
jgi:hypothetical protein